MGKEIDRLADRAERERLSSLETTVDNLNEKVEHIERSVINLASEIRSAIAELHKKSQVDWKALSVIVGLAVTIVSGYLYLILGSYARDNARIYKEQTTILEQLIEIRRGDAVTSTALQNARDFITYKIEETRTHIEETHEQLRREDELRKQHLASELKHMKEYVDERTKDRIYRSEVTSLKDRVNRVEAMHIQEENKHK